MSEFENLDSIITPEQKLGFGLNDLVEVKFLSAKRGHIRVFKYNEQGERVAEIKSPDGKDFTARLDQLKKLE